MTNTPLDAPTDFIPADDDRPAGEWMEGYWATIAMWAKRFAVLVFAFSAWQSYLEINSLIRYQQWAVGQDKIWILIIISYSVAEALLYGLLGYCCFRFAQYLERALAGQDQLLLEKAFRFLHQFWKVGLIIACLSILSSISQWSYTLNVMSEYDPGQFMEEPVPLQSED